MAKILIVDDDRAVSGTLARLISDQGHSVDRAATLEEGLKLVSIGNYDVVFVDVDMPDGNGLEALPKIKHAPSRPEIIMITGQADPDGAKLAIGNGAWDYLGKAWSPETLRLSLDRALEYRLEKAASKKPVLLERSGIVGNSPELAEILEKLAEVSASDVSVLITGETGTGKELFAHAIHKNSIRAQQNFVVVDCASLPETLAESTLFGHIRGAYTGADSSRDGLVKQAHCGTLFLDEIGDLSLNIQKAFLRVLQERQFYPLGANKEVRSNFRLVAATNRNLEQMVSQGHFRKDLYYRLRSCAIELPPLRNRSSDIRELTIHYAMNFCEEYGLATKGFSPDFFEAIKQYPWPGNIRELVNAIGNAVVAARHESTLYAKHLPQEIRIHQKVSALERHRTGASGRASEFQEQVHSDDTKHLPTFREYKRSIARKLEKEYLLKLMTLSKGDLECARRISGLGRSRLYALMKEHHVSSDPQ